MKKFCYLLYAIMLIINIGCKSNEDSFSFNETDYTWQANRINDNLSTLSMIAHAIDLNTSVTQITLNGNSADIKLSDNQSITLKTTPDTSGTLPLIGIEREKDCHYWTLSFGNFTTVITDKSGNKVPASGKNAVIPTLRISKEGIWEISVNNGKSYFSLVINGSTVPANTSDKQEGNATLFSEVTNDENSVNIQLTNGQKLVLPLSNPDSPTILVNGYVDFTTDQEIVINTSVDQYPLEKSCFSVNIPNLSIPQLIYLTNKEGDILLMSRNFFKDKPVVINAQTTAQTLICLLFPSLSQASEEEYKELLEQINKATGFEKLVTEVTRMVTNGKCVLTSDDNDLHAAIKQVFQSMSNQTQARSTEMEVPTDGKIHVSVDNKQVFLKIRGLNPPYECEILHGSENYAEKKVLPPAENVSVAEFFNNIYLNDEPHYGEPITYTLLNEGQYIFKLNCRTKNATYSLSRVIFWDLLGIVGIQPLSNDASPFIEKLIVSTAVLLIDHYGEDIPANDLVDYLISNYIDFFESVKDDLVLDVQNKVIFHINALRFFKGLLAFYDTLSTLSNVITRIEFYCKAKDTYNFSLCSYEDNEITTCDEAELIIVSGDKQTGSSGKILEKPLVVKAHKLTDDGSIGEFSPFQIVRFEIINETGGFLDEFNKTITVLDCPIHETDFTACVNWGLGNYGEQMIKAVVFDTSVGKEISNPVYFSATLDRNILTGTASRIEKETATLSGYVSGYNLKGANMYGIRYSTSVDFSDATIVPAYNITNGDFSVNIAGLKPNTTYYWSAYVKDENQNFIYGATEEFTTGEEKIEDILGDSFFRFESIRKIPRESGAYKVTFNMGDLPDETISSAYIECKCMPINHPELEQSITIPLKRFSQLHGEFRNLYSGDNVLTYSIHVSTDGVNQIVKEYGKEEFFVAYRTLKDVKLQYMGENIAVYGFTGEYVWENVYQMTCYYENNPLTFGDGSQGKRHFSVNGLNGWTFSSESSETNGNSYIETKQFKIGEDQYRIDWENFNANLQSETLQFTYSESSSKGYVFGQDYVEYDSEYFAYNQKPSLRIENLDNKQSGVLVELLWSGMAYINQSVNLDFTGAFFLIFAEFDCIHTLPEGAITHEETNFARFLDKDGNLIQSMSTLLKGVFSSNLTYNGTIAIQATLPNGIKIESSNQIQIYESENKVMWKL